MQESAVCCVKSHEAGGSSKGEFGVGLEQGDHAFLHAGFGALDKVVSGHDDLAQILQAVDDLERRCSDASHALIPSLVDDLRSLVHTLLRLEERLWPSSGETPWFQWRWLAQAAAWLGALEMAHEYANARMQTGDTEQALAAIWSGTLYAGESALAYARLQAELDGLANIDEGRRSG
jgi:hypothetical protein